MLRDLLYLEEHLSYGKTRTIVINVTCPYIDSSNTRFILTHIHFEDLQTRYQRGHSLGNPSEEGATLRGVGEVLNIEDFKLPVLLDDGEYDERIVFVCDTEDGIEHDCGLCCGSVSWSEVT